MSIRSVHSRRRVPTQRSAWALVGDRGPPRVRVHRASSCHGRRPLRSGARHARPPRVVQRLAAKEHQGRADRDRRTDAWRGRRDGAERRTPHRRPHGVTDKWSSTPRGTGPMCDRCVLGSSGTEQHRPALADSTGPLYPLQDNKKRHRTVPQDIDRYWHFHALNPRVRGSSPWRRTRDQGSELVILPRSEPFSCPQWIDVINAVELSV